MPKPSQHAYAANVHPARESAWSDIFGRNATTIRQHQLLHQRTSLLPPLLQIPQLQPPPPTSDYPPPSITDITLPQPLRR
ncbi:unnamed protein product [Schistocephalus solidus]|uniref:Uncharacterized protein n=1 Tax=Schistocephalus solidus TaxID=70667 RepID=A0A183SRK0_SCHSO|nr:unnamed protein product [Schistocephalus solidus]